MSTLVDTEVQTMTTTELHPPLRAIDRCDRCGVQAYVATQHRIVRKGEDHTTEVNLLWCAHHANKFDDVLREHIVRDERDRLAATEKPVL